MNQALWHRLQWHSQGGGIGDRPCSVRQAIILTQEAISHFQKSEPFCHVDPEESEETRFLSLLGNIFKGKFLFLLQSANSTLQLVFMAHWLYVKHWPDSQPGTERGQRGVCTVSAWEWKQPTSLRSIVTGSGRVFQAIRRLKKSFLRNEPRYFRLNSKFVLSYWEFPGNPVVRTSHFHCRGRGFNPWLGN